MGCCRTKPTRFQTLHPGLQTLLKQLQTRAPGVRTKDRVCGTVGAYFGTRRMRSRSIAAAVETHAEDSRTLRLGVNAQALGFRSSEETIETRRRGSETPGRRCDTSGAPCRTFADGSRIPAAGCESSGGRSYPTPTCTRLFDERYDPRTTNGRVTSPKASAILTGSGVDASASRMAAPCARMSALGWSARTPAARTCERASSLSSPGSLLEATGSQVLEMHWFS